MLKILWRANKLNNPKYNPFENEATLINKYTNYELRECEHPYDYTLRHLILRDTNRKLMFPFQEDLKRKEKESIVTEYRNLGYTAVENSQNDKSIPERDHTHLIIFFTYQSKYILTKDLSD